MRHHLERRAPGDHGPRLAELFDRPLVWLSYAMTATVMLAGFVLIPNISAYVQENLHFPRARLSSLYLAGGVVSFFATRFGGRLVDKLGSFRTGTVGVALLLVVQYLWFLRFPSWMPIVLLYMVFMLALGLRNVAYNTLTSKVPSERERARFLSIQSAVQHAASAFGAILSAQLLSERPDHSLEGMPLVATVAIVLTATAPAFLWAVERGVRRDAPPRVQEVG
jgi:predicted MFS family arabinose efflux permease